jgi:hypothetical protein
VASPLLFDACDRKHLKEGTLEVQQGKSVVVRWVFQGMLVTASGSGAADSVNGLTDTFVACQGDGTTGLP